jgi:hypothetical protein
MITSDLERWFKDEQAVVELKTALSNGYVRRALELITRIGLPSQQELPANIGLLEFGALSNATREGYFQALRNLEALATSPTAGERATPQRPWEYLLNQPAEATKPVAKRRTRKITK